MGYGENGFSADGKGMACIWSIKNPEVCLCISMCLRMLSNACWHLHHLMAVYNQNFCVTLIHIVTFHYATSLCKIKFSDNHTLFLFLLWLLSRKKPRTAIVYGSQACKLKRELSYLFFKFLSSYILLFIFLSSTSNRIGKYFEKHHQLIMFIFFSNVLTSCLVS